MIIRKVKKINANENVKQAFIFAFTLLQNAATLSEFEQVLENMFILFNSKFENNQVRCALLQINSKIRDRKKKLEALYLNPENENIEFNMDDERELNPDENECDTISSIVKKSPFTSYFAKKHSEFSKILKKPDSFKLSEFYAPNLYSCLFDYLHLIPLWTGIGLSSNGLLNSVNQTVSTRLSNNPVERWFGISKNILFIDINLFPNAIATILYENIEATYIKHYKLSWNKELLKSSKDNLNEQKEIWDRGGRKPSNKPFYFENKWQIKGLILSFVKCMFLIHQKIT
jgi:hypothetical protein